MAMGPSISSEVSMQCSVKVGYFLARACEETATSFCDMCRQPACHSHLRPSGVPGGTGVLCIPCFQSQQKSSSPRRSRNSGHDSDSFDDSFSSSSSSGSSSTGSDESITGAGGEFGGGGSSGGWVPAAQIGGDSNTSTTSTTGAGSDLPLGAGALQSDDFSADDIASFDEVTSADKGAGKSGVYDS